VADVYKSRRSVDPKTAAAVGVVTAIAAGDRLDALAALRQPSRQRNVRSVAFAAMSSISCNGALTFLCGYEIEEIVTLAD
jgi:hypothetical protein